jgi:hypothetical protein
MLADNFRRAEAEYARLRHEFDNERLSIDAFEKRLRALMIQDEQGSYWMLGVESGKWYVYAGEEWVEREPQRYIAAHEAITAAPHPAWWFMVIGANLLLLGLAAFLWFQARGTPIPNADARRAKATATAYLTPVAAVNVATSTSVPESATPFRITLTPTGKALVIIPTVTPLSLSVTPTAPLLPTQPNLPPNVYVTHVSVSPPNPKRQEPITFSADFLNTTGQTRSYAWRAVILNPNKPGRNKDFGESPVSRVNIPNGPSHFSITYTAVTNTGDCILLEALAAWRREDTARIFFPDTNGEPFRTRFNVCP